MADGARGSDRQHLRYALCRRLFEPDARSLPAVSGPLIGPVGKVKLDGVHWAIVGGESGPGARPMKHEWIEEIRSQCATQVVAFFFKQWGGVNKKISGRVHRGRTWDEFPKDSLRDHVMA
jgi:protein gp37